MRLPMSSVRSGRSGLGDPDFEIGEAAWFHRDRLPDTSHRPPPYTIAGRLIQRWVEQGTVPVGTR